MDRVRRFVNTRRQEFGEDVLADPGQASAWLDQQGYRPPPRLSAQTLGHYRDARESVRALLMGDPAALDRVDGLLATAGPVRAALRAGPDGPTAGVLPSSREPADDPLRDVLLAVWRGAANGEIRRLKICADDRCRLCFYDRSRNLSRIWCTGGDCGNRNRVARHRARVPAA